MRFLPKYLQTIGAGLWVIGLFDGIRTVLGALYAYPGGVISDRWGHRRALMSFTSVSIVGYALVLAIPHWGAVVGGSLLFLAWTCFFLPATFSLIAATLDRGQLSMGIGVQSVIRRIPNHNWPCNRGALIDRFGVENGVRLGLGVTIVLSTGALCIHAKIQETTPVAAPHLDGFWKALRKFNPALSRLFVSDILIRFCERIPFAWVVIYAMDHLGVSGTHYLIRDLIVAFGAILGAALLRISPQANFTTAVVIGAVATLGYCSCVRLRKSPVPRGS